MSFSAPSQLVARTPHCLAPPLAPPPTPPPRDLAVLDACFLAVYARYACPVYKQSQTSRRYKLRLSPSLCEHATIPRRLHLSTPLEPAARHRLSLWTLQLATAARRCPPSYPSVPRSPVRNPILDFCSSEANAVGKRPLYRSEAREARAARLPTLPGIPPGIPPLASPPHPPPTTPTVPTLPTIEQKSRSPSSVPDEGCNQRSSEVIRRVQAACLKRDAIRGHQRSPRSGPSRRAHHDALTTTRFLTFRYGPCSLMRSRALRLNPQWPACLSITRRSRTQSGNLTEPLMRNAVILALSDAGDGLAALCSAAACA